MTVPNTFEPDLDGAGDATRSIGNRYDMMVAAWQEIQRQMAAAGFVVVRRKDVELLYDFAVHQSDFISHDERAAANELFAVLRGTLCR